MYLGENMRATFFNCPCPYCDFPAFEIIENEKQPPWREKRLNRFKRDNYSDKGIQVAAVEEDVKSKSNSLNS